MGRSVVWVPCVCHTRASLYLSTRFSLQTRSFQALISLGQPCNLDRACLSRFQTSIRKPDRCRILHLRHACPCPTSATAAATYVSSTLRTCAPLSLETLADKFCDHKPQPPLFLYGSAPAAIPVLKANPNITPKTKPTLPNINIRTMHHCPGAHCR